MPNRNRRRNKLCRTYVAPETLAEAHWFLANSLSSDINCPTELFEPILHWLGYGENTSNESLEERLTAVEAANQKMNEQLTKLIQYFERSKTEIAENMIVSPVEDEESAPHQPHESTHSVVEDLVHLHNASLDQLAKKAKERKDKLKEHAKVLKKIREDINTKKKTIFLANQQIKREEDHLKELEQKKIKEMEEKGARIQSIHRQRSGDEKELEELYQMYKARHPEYKQLIEEHSKDPYTNFEHATTKLQKRHRWKKGQEAAAAGIEKYRTRMIKEKREHDRKSMDDEDAATDAIEQARNLGITEKRYLINIWK